MNTHPYVTDTELFLSELMRVGVNNLLFYKNDSWQIYWNIAVEPAKNTLDFLTWTWILFSQGYNCIIEQYW